jgi:alpha-tubulin suppressor-like RCC1 family protein
MITKKPLPIDRIHRSPAYVLTNTSRTSGACCALDSYGYAWAWGLNTSGKLGDNSATNRSSPVAVVGGKNFKTISTGELHTVALDLSSYAWAWGRNTNSSLGDGTTITKSSPVSVVGGYQFKTISVGNLFTIALDASNYAWSWGLNSVGQLGNNDYIVNKNSPVSVAGGKTWLSVSAGSGFTVAIDSSSNAWAWGIGTSGQLGNGDIVNNQSSPVSVLAGGKKWIAVSVGSFVVALDASSFAWTWGSSNRSVPTSVPGGKQFKMVSAGNQFAVALDASNYAWSWGLGTSGQLGDGTIVDKTIPVSVYGAKTWSSISAGDSVTALDTSGNTWNWGINSQGQFGDNSITNRSTPTIMPTNGPFKIFGGI